MPVMPSTADAPTVEATEVPTTPEPSTAHDPVTEKVLDNMPARRASTPTRKAATKKATAPRNTAAKPAAKATKATTAKPATTKPGKKASRYPSWVPDAVRRSRVISARKDPGADPATWPSYPGPVQHIKIRKTVTARIDRDPTPEKILAVTGIKSYKRLREIAEWSADKSEMAPMRPLSKQFAPDGWAMGRYLASALVAWIDQIKDRGEDLVTTGR
jgi:hypothetical protein